MDDLDALLADLQNNVPGQGHKTLPSHNNKNSAHVTFAEQNNTSSSGYGSLNGVKKPLSTSTNSYNENDFEIPIQHQNGSDAKFPAGNGGGNLTELDMLLEDLSNARYNNQASLQKSNYNGSQSPSLVQSNYSLNSTIKRPSVDSLLDELSNAHTSPVYAVPNTPKTPEDQKQGKHVTITVRETTTEKIRGTPSPHYVQQQQAGNNHGTLSKPAPNKYTSSATKELDDLMESLSDFKVNQSSHHQQQVTDYYPEARQGTSHFESSTTVVTTDLPPTGDQLDSMLGKLRANMSSQGINTMQKGCCNACDKPIVGQVITALGKTWHPEHFTCNHCQEELGTRNFFERDGHPYCETDYHNLFSPRCAYCNGPILDKCVTALEKTWHTEHFFCAQCGQQFGEEGFHERDGKPYCRADYFDQFAPKCSGCNRAIMENYISALNSQWHPDCFVCRDCKKPVTGKSFYAMEGHPVCPPCVGVDDE